MIDLEISSVHRFCLVFSKSNHGPGCIVSLSGRIGRHPDYVINEPTGTTILARALLEAVPSVPSGFFSMRAGMTGTVSDKDAAEAK